jgi:hypothetical protein
MKKQQKTPGIKYNLIYRLRKKGYHVTTRSKTIMAPYLSDPARVRQIRRLMDEYNFQVQFQIE